jgi:hypothetical protein
MTTPRKKAISKTCEVLCSRGECGLPTTHVYPAMGGGYMALCLEHSHKHPEAWPIAEIDVAI